VDCNDEDCNVHVQNYVKDNAPVVRDDGDDDDAEDFFVADSKLLPQRPRYFLEKIQKKE